MNKSEIERLVASVDVWYHVVDLGHGVLTPGMYDMRPTVEHYGFPASLAGKQVLDVGASNGFFSFLFESRGAERVVATNLASYRQHDYPRWFLEKKVSEMTSEQLAKADHHESRGGFEVAKKCLGSRVEHLLTPIYDLGKIDHRFDFAFCGSVLVHLRDPVLGLESIRSVLRPGAELIVATPVDTTQRDRSYALFNGKPEEVSWWVMSPACLTRMAAMAGFVDVTWRSEFVIESRHGFTDKIGVVSMRRP